jgi:nucleotide-binding universal stress UspA family protein
VYRAIVVPLDGFATAERAVPVAARLARSSRAKVHLVHVVDLLAVPPYAEGAPSSEWWSGGAVRLAESYLQRLAEVSSTTYGVEFTTALLPEPIVSSLLSYADRVDAGLIVTTTHGKAPLQRLWVGSVADELARSATCPVLFLRASEVVPAERAEDRFRRILVPLDESPLSESVLPAALALAKAEQAGITLLTAWAPHPMWLATDALMPPPVPTPPHTVQEEVLAYLESVAATLRDDDMDVRTEVVNAGPGSVADAILEFERSNDIDVVALSTHGAGGLRRLLIGSVADKLLRASTKPVLLYRPEEV